MDRDLLSHLPVVLAVARHNGFAPGAAALRMSPSAVRHAVRIVEDRLGAPLFARTTRSVALTEAGARLVASVEPALADIGKAAESLSAERGEITGLLRINAPRAVLEVNLSTDRIPRRPPSPRQKAVVCAAPAPSRYVRRS